MSSGPVDHARLFGREVPVARPPGAAGCVRVNAREFVLTVNDGDKRTLGGAGVEYGRSYRVIGGIARRSEDAGRVTRSRLLEPSVPVDRTTNVAVDRNADCS